MKGVAPSGLVFKAHRLLYHSTLGSRGIKKKRKRSSTVSEEEGLGLDRYAQREPGKAHLG
jgi:hypothetical protein